MDEFEDPISTRSLADYWEIALRRRWTILLPFFLCWLAAWSVSWLIPSVYKSEAVILVEQQKVPEQYVVPNVTASLQDSLQSMTEQILSRTRLQSTISRFHLYQARQGLNKLMPSGDPVDQMRKDIKIELVNAAERPGQLTGFKIAYSANSPQLAQQINSELTSLFIEENLKTQQQLSEGTTAFLQSQLEEARKELETQEAKVRAYKAEHFGDLPSQAEANVQILSGLQTQLQNTQHALDGANQQKLYLESLQQQYQTAQAAQDGIDTTDPSETPIKALAKELVKLRHQLEDARSKLTDEHPDVIALKDKIAKTEKLKKDMEAETASHPETPKTVDPSAAAEVQHGSPTPMMMQTQSQLKAIKLEIENDQQHVRELESQISSYRTRLNMTPQTEQQLADVSRGYEESKTNYNSLLQKQNQSELATSLQQRQQGQQFRIIDPPSLPSRPAAPNHLMVSLGGLAAGALLGLGLAAFLEMSNVLVRREEDLEGIVPTRVLVGIPHLSVPGEDRFDTVFHWLEIAAVAAIALSILAGNLFALLKSGI